MADYIEFTVNVNEDSAVDSQSSINEKVRDASDRPSESTKLNKQARENMRENNAGNTSSELDSKAIKAFITNKVIKTSIDTSLRVAEENAIQKFKYGGNSAAMNKMNNTINNIKSGVSIGTNIVEYGIAGFSVGGPWGAAIGAAIGTVMSAVDSIVNYNNNNSQLQWDLQRERLLAANEANRLGLVSAGRGRISHREFML